MQGMRGIVAFSCGLVFTWLASTAAIADDLQDSRPTITATVTLPPSGGSGRDHSGSDNPSPAPVCVATPAPGSDEVVDRYNSLHHRTASGLSVVEVDYYSEQNSLHRYNV